MKSLSKYLIAALFSLMCVFTLGNIKAEAASVPAQVTELKQDGVGSSYISITWKALLDDVNYVVEISEDGKYWPDSLSKSVVFNDASYSNLNAGSTYYVRVRAYKVEWNSEINEAEYIYGPWSKVIECTTCPSTYPKNIKTTGAADTSVSLSWEAISDANAYVVYYKPYLDNTDYKSVTVNTNKVTLKGLKKNTRHQVYVYAARTTSDKSYVAYTGSTYVYKIVRLRPAKVTGVSIKHYWYSLNQIAVEADEKQNTDDYQAELWTVSKNAKKLASSTNNSSAYFYLKHSYVSKYRMLKVRVRGYNNLSDGKTCYGTWSDWKYICRQPAIKTKALRGKGIKVSWQKIDDAERYYVYMSTNSKSGFKKIATTSGTSTTVTKWNKKALKNSKKYYFKVIPVTKEGKSWKAADSDQYIAYSCQYRK